MPFVLPVLNVARGAVGFVSSDHLMPGPGIGLTVVALAAGRSWRSQVDWIARSVTTRTAQLAFFVAPKAANGKDTILVHRMKLGAAPLIFALAQ